MFENAGGELELTETEKAAAAIIADLCSLNFFPRDDDGRTAVFKLFGALCSDLEQVRWLVGRLVALYDDWPGPASVRAVFCVKYRPRDGVEGSKFLRQFKGPVPLENPLPPPSFPKWLPPAETSEEIAEDWARLVDSVEWPQKVKPKIKKLPAPVSPSLRAVLELQMDEARRKLRKDRSTPHSFVEPVAAGSSVCSFCFLPYAHPVHYAAAAPAADGVSK